MSNLLIIGLFVGTIWAVMRWRAALKKNVDGRWYDVLLAFLSVIIISGAIALESGADSAFGIGELMVITLGIALFVPGVRLLLLANKPLASVGSMSAVVGIILTISAFAVPTYAQTIASQETVILPGASQASALPFMPFASAGNPISSDFDVLQLPEPAAEVPMAIPTLVNLTPIFMTPTPHPELATQCDALVTARLNLRDAPSTVAGNIVTVLESDAEIVIVAQDSSADWWYTLNDEVEGWVYGDFLNLDDTCTTLPVRGWTE